MTVSNVIIIIIIIVNRHTDQVIHNFIIISAFVALILLFLWLHCIPFEDYRRLFILLTFQSYSNHFWFSLLFLFIFLVDLYTYEYFLADRTHKMMNGAANEIKYIILFLYYFIPSNVFFMFLCFCFFFWLENCCYCLSVVGGRWSVLSNVRKSNVCYIAHWYKCSQAPSIN